MIRIGGTPEPAAAGVTSHAVTVCLVGGQMARRRFQVGLGSDLPGNAFGWDHLLIRCGLPALSEPTKLEMTSSAPGPGATAG